MKPSNASKMILRSSLALTFCLEASTYKTSNLSLTLTFPIARKIIFIALDVLDDEVSKAPPSLSLGTKIAETPSSIQSYNKSSNVDKMYLMNFLIDKVDNLISEIIIINAIKVKEEAININKISLDIIVNLGKERGVKIINSIRREMKNSVEMEMSTNMK